ncbi:STAS domain-containing protein [[Brevibacterium] frigoritolerans]|nr:STAS domain-containing protein [Peribacillus frigoritolerans]
MSLTLMKMGKYLSDNSDSLALEVVENVLSYMNLKISKQEEDQAIAIYIELFGFLGNTLAENTAEEVPQPLIDWSKDNAMEQVLAGRISEIVIRYSPTREVLTDIITRLSVEFKLSLEENSHIIKWLNKILDLSLHETIFAFEEFSNKFKVETLKEMAELSAPIVPIKQGMAIVPLIGNFDQYRIDYLTDKMIPKIVELKIESLIMDFSGVPTIETEFAHSLSQIGSTLCLLGVEIIITGVSPKLAKIAGQIGIDTRTAKTFGTLKQALDYETR